MAISKPTRNQRHNQSESLPIEFPTDAEPTNTIHGVAVSLLPGKGGINTCI